MKSCELDETIVTVSLVVTDAYHTGVIEPTLDPGRESLCSHVRKQYLPGVLICAHAILVRVQVVLVRVQAVLVRVQAILVRVQVVLVCVQAVLVCV